LKEAKMRKAYLVLLLALGGLVGTPDHSFGRQPGNVRGQAFAFPKDSKLLFDQIKLKIRFADADDDFVVTTRPVQHLSLSIADKSSEGQVRKFSLQVIPRAFNGKPLAERDQSPVIAGQFAIVVNCLEETPTGQSDRPLLPNGGECRPRSKNNQRLDDVIRLDEIENVGLNEPREDLNTRATITILGYRYGVPGLAEENNPFEKICLNTEDVKVCGCRVKYGGRVSSAGCQ
jgi:hypothetical protein